MPWEIEKRDGKFCVVKKGTSTSEGCHSTRADAVDQLKALYASEPKMAGDIEDAIFHLKLALEVHGEDEELAIHLEEALAALGDYEDEIEAVTDFSDGMEEYAWAGPIVFENVATGDNRIFKSNSINWEEDTLPWAFRWQKSSGQGHAGSVPVGRVDRLERMDDGSIKGYGVVIPALSDEATEYLKLLKTGVGGGVSVDGDSAQFDVTEMADGQPRVEFSSMRLRALSAVDIPAFNGARIHLVDSSTPEKAHEEYADDSEETLSDEIIEIEVEAEELAKKKKKKAYGWKFDGLVAAAIPVLPTIEAFVDPEFAGPTPLTITKDGRVFGHLALFNTCHIGFPGTCVKPPKGSKYQYFHTGQIETAEGDLVDVGHLTFNTGHAAMQANPKAAAEHYDNTGTVAADVRAGEDQFGIWVVGALRSHLSDEDIRAFRAAPLSGDWRRIAGRLELVGALAVNVPGFPVPRAKALVASGETETLFTFLEDDDEEFISAYELQLRLDKKLSLSQRVGPTKVELSEEAPVELATSVDDIVLEGSDPISDYELQLRINKKLGLIERISGDTSEFAQSLDAFLSEKDGKEPTEDNLPDPEDVPDLPNAPTKKDIENIAKNYTQAELLHDLQDLRDLLDDPDEKINAKDRKNLEALYALFVTTNKAGKKVTAAGEDIEEFYNHCHGKGGRFCATGGRGGGGGGGGVSGKAGGPGGRPGGGRPHHGGKPGGGKPGGFDKYSHDREQAVKQLSSYRTSKISARRWAVTSAIASAAALAVRGGLPLIKLVGPITPLAANPAILAGLTGLGLFQAGKQLIAAKNHKRDFSSTIDRIQKRQKIDEQIRLLNAKKP